MDYVCMGIFTVEYVARLLTTPVLGPFFTSFSNFIDLVAIAPFYLELMITGSSTGEVPVWCIQLMQGSLPQSTAESSRRMHLVHHQVQSRSMKCRVKAYQGQSDAEDGAVC